MHRHWHPSHPHFPQIALILTSCRCYIISVSARTDYLFRYIYNTCSIPHLAAAVYKLHVFSRRFKRQILFSLSPFFLFLSSRRSRLIRQYRNSIIPSTKSHPFSIVTFFRTSISTAAICENRISCCIMRRYYNILFTYHFHINRYY